MGIGWSDKERGTQRQDRMTRCKICHRVQICWAKTESFLYYHSATFWGNKSNRKTHFYLGYFYTTSSEFCLKQLIIKTISKYQKQACKQKLLKTDQIKPLIKNLGKKLCFRLAPKTKQSRHQVSLKEEGIPKANCNHRKCSVFSCHLPHL